MSQRVESAKGVTVWAAFNPETGECMLPTVRGWKEGAIYERDRLYPGCPIHDCWLSPNFPVEDVNKIAKKWPK